MSMPAHARPSTTEARGAPLFKRPIMCVMLNTSILGASSSGHMLIVLSECTPEPAWSRNACAVE
jgi:hypothetical protein